MSIQTRREILSSIKLRYGQSNSKERKKILNNFVAITGYCRKHAIHLLGRHEKSEDSPVSRSSAIRDSGSGNGGGEYGAGGKSSGRGRRKHYDEATTQSLLTLWYAANQICSKRLVPFIPDLLVALERFGHISLPLDIRNRLLQISPATVDRLLAPYRQNSNVGISTTRPGGLLKNQIKVRTFADWNDVVPGFMEADLVAHCGTSTSGSFLNSLVLTDIASGWTEFFPLLSKCDSGVIAALKSAGQLLPFLLLGLDTDNGSEFINYALLDFCKTQKITFTRSRAYKKNDQAHVEEKNGSIIRRLIGYDRYEGLDAYNALSELYATLRLYVNFFQPSLKLVHKKRDGAKVTKKYDKAKTPCQRLLLSKDITEDIKTKLNIQYNSLDPIILLKEVEKLQDKFWSYAWKPEVLGDKSDATLSDPTLVSSTIDQPYKIAKPQQIDQAKTLQETAPSIRRYRNTRKRGKHSVPRTHRTRPDDFKDVWNEIRIKLELNPAQTAKGLLEELSTKYPDQFNMSKLRTMQHRVAEWRQEQIKINQEKNYSNFHSGNSAVTQYVALVTQSVIRA